MKINHLHFVGRFRVKYPPTGVDEVFLGEWIKRLIADQNMTLLSGPHVEYVEDEGNRGLTAVAILKTSHMAIHVWDEEDPALIQLDFFTCSKLDVERIITAVEPWGIVEQEFFVIDREKNLEIIEICRRP